jgi:hypothetical protein
METTASPLSPSVLKSEAIHNPATMKNVSKNENNKDVMADFIARYIREQRHCRRKMELFQRRYI